MDLTQKQCFHWFIGYVCDPDQASFKVFFSLPQGTDLYLLVAYQISRYRYPPDDDERASMPTSSTCLAILNIPTLHSVEATLIESLDCALKCEAKDFSMYY